MSAILPATVVREQRDDARMLVIDAGASAEVVLADTHVRDLPRWLSAGDVLVVNDAATLPASLHGRTASGDAIELRLTGPIEHDHAQAVLFGRGDFRTDTAHRPAPPELAPGATLELGELRARVVTVSALSPRLLQVRFDRDGAALLAAVYRHGTPVQYAYHPRALPLHAFQTAYATRPWAAEMPSAGRPLGWSLLRSLRVAGVSVVALTHAAGLSATGDPAIDAALPLAERFEIPAPTVAAIADAHGRRARVIAVGTSVVRALEGSAALHGGNARAGVDETALIIGAGFQRRVVDGLLTGVHGPGDSHFELLRAFASADALREAHDHAARAGYLGHELGDSMLVLA
jgi:S-adenosylmethionine:tRNA ribosyltransferase-isomerase